MPRTSPPHRSKTCATPRAPGRQPSANGYVLVTRFTDVGSAHGRAATGRLPDVRGLAASCKPVHRVRANRSGSSASKPARRLPHRRCHTSQESGSWLLFCRVDIRLHLRQLENPHSCATVSIAPASVGPRIRRSHSWQRVAPSPSSYGSSIPSYFNVSATSSAPSVRLVVAITYVLLAVSPCKSSVCRSHAAQLDLMNQLPGLLVVHPEHRPAAGWRTIQ